MQAITRSYYVGAIFALIHLVAVIDAVLSVRPNDLPWVWMIFFPIDFPWSLLSVGGLHAMLNIWGDVHWGEQWKHTVYAYWPVFVHGIIGSLWWGTIPILVGKVLSKRKQ